MWCSAGDNLQQETPQKEDKDLSIHPIFSIAVDCTSALSMPSVLDAPSSNPSLTSPGMFTTTCFSDTCLICCMKNLKLSLCSAILRVMPARYCDDVGMTESLLRNCRCQRSSS